MKYILQFCIILCLLLAGNLISFSLNSMIQIPGAIIGLILLLILLMTGIIKEKDIKETCDYFLNNLVFFFIPAGVGILANFGLIKNDLLSIVILVIVSSTVSILITALVTQFLIKLKKE